MRNQKNHAATLFAETVLYCGDSYSNSRQIRIRTLPSVLLAVNSRNSQQQGSTKRFFLCSGNILAQDARKPVRIKANRSTGAGEFSALENRLKIDARIGRLEWGKSPVKLRPECAAD
jgi:hypothetical protein